MKLVIVMGTPRKNGAGAGYVSVMLDAVRDMPGVETETLWLGDCDIRQCRGCMACYERGEEACPLKDGYLEAIRRLNSADAVVFYSPTYALSISGTMKTFFDRSSWVLHRPHFKGRRAVVLTSAASWGQKPALRTLRQIVSMMGFDVVGAEALCNARRERDARYRARVGTRLRAHAQRLMRVTLSGRPVRPALAELVAFRLQQASFGADGPGCANDKRVWKESGWADAGADFYCKARISPVRAAIARAAAYVLRKSGRIPMG